MENYLKLHRKMLDWGWYGDINTTRLFIHILLMANWLPGECYGIRYEAGEFITSLEKLAKETHLTISQVRTALKHLEMTGEVASKSQGRCRVITVNNWNVYQASDKVVRKKVASKSQEVSREIATELDIKNKEEKNKYYDDTDLNKAFSDYVSMRKQIKKPMTDHAVDLAKKKLKDLSGDNKETAIKIIEQSIMGSWQGLFPLRQEQKENKFSKGMMKHGYDFNELEKEVWNT